MSQNPAIAHLSDDANQKVWPPNGSKDDRWLTAMSKEALAKIEQDSKRVSPNPSLQREYFDTKSANIYHAQNVFSRLDEIPPPLDEDLKGTRDYATRQRLRVGAIGDHQAWAKHWAKYGGDRWKVYLDSIITREDMTAMTRPQRS